ncbi:MAG TPA: arsenate reductase ArsC [Acidobacteriaceae bacterium]|jgi:arsenate reductase|nr:arsenate reductase ArsC [Acidobacteriaceae bacterium]
MSARYNVLFLCTGNSARSIMAEAILRHKGRPTFAAFSAGSHPTGYVNPHAIRQLQEAHLDAEGLYSKSWDEFSKADAPPLNFVFTVCDKAAAEVCPYWPGQPMTAHWGIPDPVAVQGAPDEIDRAFKQAFATLDRRIGLFLCLPIATLDQFALRKELDEIGHK